MCIPMHSSLFRIFRCIPSKMLNQFLYAIATLFNFWHSRRIIGHDLFFSKWTTPVHPFSVNSLPDRINNTQLRNVPLPPSFYISSLLLWTLIASSVSLHFFLALRWGFPFILLVGREMWSFGKKNIWGQTPNRGI